MNAGWLRKVSGSNAMGARPALEEGSRRKSSVCPKCNHHYKISAYDRINLLMDPGWTEHDGSLYSTDLSISKPTSRTKRALASLPEKIGVQEAVVTVQGTMDTIPVVLSAMNTNFIGGSMGSVVGEKITRAIERSLDSHSSLVVVSCSGGPHARGALSLMQMAKISPRSRVSIRNACRIYLS